MKERHWRRLLADIEGGQVIPVVGPELIEVEIDGNPTPLYRYLGREIVRRLDLPEDDLEDDYSFENVVSEFMVQQSLNPKDYRQEDLYYEIRDILEGRNWTTPKPLQKLAAISHFKLFVSTTFDSELEGAINEARFGGERKTRNYAYCTKSEVVDLPGNFTTTEGPAIYSFFGKVNPVNDFAVTDEDVLEFAHRLQSRDLRPHNLFDQFRNKHLLTLGCSFPGWLTRFFLAAAKGDELFSIGSPGVLADDFSLRDKGLVGFLERRKTNVFRGGNAIQFVNELHDKWFEKFGGSESESEVADDSPADEMAEFLPDSIFISFHSNDRQVAREISSRFEAAGIDVWFDEADLNAGDNYRIKIETNIERSLYFMPLISSHSVSGERRFFQLEWNKAIDEAKFRPQSYPFIQPIILDGTKPEDEGIPREFRACHFQWLKDLDALIDLTRKRIRERRRERKVA